MIEINFGILAAQVVTFLIGLFLLWKIAWGPLTAILKKRRDDIKNDIESARVMREEVEQMKEKYMAEMNKLEQRAAEIISKATGNARKIHEDIMKEATAEARAFTERTHKYMEKQRESMMDEMRAEVAKFAVLGAEKILRQSVSKEVQQKAVEEMLEELDKQ